MLCSFARWHVSNRLDGGGDLASWARRHLARCASCDAFAQRLFALHGKLTAEAASAPAPLALAPRRIGRRVAWLALAAAASATVLYVVLPRHAEVPAPAPVATEIRTPVVDQAEPLASHALASANRWIDAAPLRDELSALTSDTLRGARVVLGPLAALGSKRRRAM